MYGKTFLVISFFHFFLTIIISIGQKRIITTFFISRNLTLYSFCLVNRFIIVKTIICVIIIITKTCVFVIRSILCFRG